MTKNTADVLSRSFDSGGAAARSRLGWSDFLSVLTVARTGSLSRAKWVLAVSHVTLLRKLDAIETGLKARLFDRSRGTYTTTEAGAAVVEAAEAMEPLAHAAEMSVLEQDVRPAGHVRVTVAGVVIDELLAPILGVFTGAFPQVTVEWSRRAFDALDRLAGFMQDNPERTIKIEGHTDSVGSDTFNIGLSQRRAESVRAALLARGVEGGRIATEGPGKARPVASNATAEGRQRNRRVEIVISGRA